MLAYPESREQRVGGFMMYSLEENCDKIVLASERIHYIKHNREKEKSVGIRQGNIFFLNILKSSGPSLIRPTFGNGKLGL